MASDDALRGVGGIGDPDNAKLKRDSEGPLGEPEGGLCRDTAGEYEIRGGEGWIDKFETAGSVDGIGRRSPKSELGFPASGDFSEIL
jgi:hypothetical protein